MYSLKKGWYVLYVMTNHEKKVNQRLQNSGFNTFLPLLTVRNQWKDRKKEIEKPLFPSYIFIDIENKQDFNKALQVTGALGYVRFGDQYPLINEMEMNKIKHFANLKGISEINHLKHIPEVGEKIIINHGALSGLDCEVLRIDKKNKIFVRIESIKLNISATIPLDFIKRCEIS